MITHDHFHPAAQALGAEIPITPTEKLVTGVYASVDAAAAGEVGRLLSEEGITPSCQRGCWYCCRYHILINVAEAHTLAQYVKRDMPAAQVDALRIRTRQWQAWDNSRPGRYPAADMDTGADLADYVHRCPLLVDGACSAYPVRPVVCRTHLVRSHPRLCQAAGDPESTQDRPAVLKSVVAVAAPFSAIIKDHIEKSGLDFSRSIMLLPHWLAAEMQWDLSPSS